MSNSNMGAPRRVICYILYIGFSLLVGYVLLFAMVQIQQRILRHRAEKLLADVQSLRVRSATFDQAVEVFDRWQPWGSYDLPCSSESCHFSIALYSPGSAYGWVVPLYRIVGSRPCGARASISVNEGLVSKVEFGLGIDVPPFVDASGTTVAYGLSAEVTGGPRSIPGDLLYADFHSEYAIGWPSGCTSCVDIWFAYTPYANPADVQRVGGPNFDCITGWRQCRTKADIMPAAMTQVASDRAFQRGDRPRRTPEVVETISRDAEDAAIVRIVANRSDSQCQGCGLLKVRLVRPLKRSLFWKVGSTYNLGVVQGVAIAPLNDVSNLLPGSRAIILFDRNLQPAAAVPILEEPCGVVPFNAQMLQLVQRGIANDNLPPWSGNPDFIALRP
ncbi:MAG: hypothetical protein WAN23_17310 [Candidatus Acidiferrales bacterium]